MVWLRIVPLSFFAITALVLMGFQFMEIVHAFIDLFFSKDK